MEYIFQEDIKGMTQIVEILSALFLEKGLERYIMIQSKRIAELMDIYKQAEKCYKYNQSSSFYRSSWGSRLFRPWCRFCRRPRFRL